MDKITRIKRLVESFLDTSFGGDISIVSLEILPTQKYDEETNKWVPDSHTLFLIIKRMKKNDDNYVDLSTNKVGSTLEDLLGFDACVDII